MTTESAGEDDNFGTESSQQAIMKCLGGERRNRVLAGLYMGRSDTALMVRQAALHVWKVGKNRVLAGLYMERTGCWPGCIWKEPGAGRALYGTNLKIKKKTSQCMI